MASFFRKRIADKILVTLQKRYGINEVSQPKHIEQCVSVLQKNSSLNPVLVLPWQAVEKICHDLDLNITSNDFLRQLQNQGLPTAEGIIDIYLRGSTNPALFFSIDKHVFSKIVLHDIHANEDNLLRNSCLFEDVNKRNIVVQFCAPALGDQFHMTHFRTAIHASYLTKINKFIGHNVIKVNHVHDWGLDAAILLTGYKKFKAEEGNDKNSVLDITELKKASMLKYENDLKFKEDANSCYSKMKAGDFQLLSKHQDLSRICMDYNNSVLKRTGVRFDESYFDSSQPEKFEELSLDLQTKGTFNKDGTYTKDVEFEIGTFKDKSVDLNVVLYHISRYINAANQMYEKYKFDSLYFVAPTTQDYISTFTSLASDLNYPWAKNFEHVKLMRIHDFDSMKKLTITKILDQAKDIVLDILHNNLQLEVNENVEYMAECLGVSSLIMHDFKHSKKIDYAFDWKQVLSFGQNTAASFMFCLNGLKGLKEQSKIHFGEDVDTSALLENDAHYLVTHLSRFDEIILRAYVSQEPCIIYRYLSTLGWLISKATDVLKLDAKGDRTRVIKARLYLFSACKKILDKSLNLLNIPPLVLERSTKKSSVHSE